MYEGCMPRPCLKNTTAPFLRTCSTRVPQNWADRSLYTTTTTRPTAGNDSTPCIWSFATASSSFSNLQIKRSSPHTHIIPLSCCCRINPRNMTTETGKPVIRVAVIGAGASGLTQTQQLLEAWSRKAVKTKLEVVAFEARGDVGGVW